MSKTVKDTAEIFKALGDASRLRILKLIAATGNNVCVGMIATKLDISQPSVSQHLKILKNVGLVEDIKQGYFVHYTIKNNSLAVFGIDTHFFLKSFGAEMDLNNYCKLKEDSENCNKVNS